MHFSLELPFLFVCPLGRAAAIDKWQETDRALKQLRPVKLSVDGPDDLKPKKNETDIMFLQIFYKHNLGRK